jgi:PAS domain-containing protein
LYLTKIFAASPLLAFALCIALATILWCILLARRQRSGLDKILTGLLGLIAVYEALRILRDSGFPIVPIVRRMDAWTDLIIAGLCLIAALILRVSSIDRATTKAQLRLVEANEKSIDLLKSTGANPAEVIHGIFDASPLAACVVDVHGVVTYWNAAARTLTGWTRDEIMGRKLPFHSHGPVVDKCGQELEAPVWTSFVECSPGTMGGFLVIAAGRPALEAAGITQQCSRPQDSIPANQ